MTKIAARATRVLLARALQPSDADRRAVDQGGVAQEVICAASGAPRLCSQATDGKALFVTRLIDP
jgi:hypothetical protein